jgi:hypothetical protein
VLCSYNCTWKSFYPVARASGLLSHHVCAKEAYTIG